MCWFDFSERVDPFVSHTSHVCVTEEERKKITFYGRTDKKKIMCSITSYVIIGSRGNACY